MSKRALIVITGAVLCAFLLTGVVLALAPPPTPQLNWWVIGGGGGHAEAGAYALDGTLGQAVMGLSSNTSNRLCAGFWCGALVGMPAPLPTPRPVYLPLVRRGP